VARTPCFGVLVLLVLTLAACKTTGDPREGGLFGWSETKAKERQRDLEREDLEAQRKARDEDHRNQALTKERNVLEKDQTGLEREIETLIQENTQLEKRLTTLLGQEELRTGELAHFSEVLSQNRKMREELRTRPAEPGSPGTVPQALSEQNQRLHQEILALLRR
jgi:septal ring factor EnvC (AmiA/AmiB activator)